MENFSEAMDTKEQLLLDIQMEVAAHHGPAVISMSINELAYSGPLDDKHYILWHECPLDTALRFNLTVVKGTVEIVRITIDGKEIMPLYMEHSNPPTNLITPKTAWELSIPNFYTWYHGITGQGWIA